MNVIVTVLCTCAAVNIIMTYQRRLEKCEKHLIILKLWQCFVTCEQMCCHLPEYASQETHNFDT